MIQRIWKTIEKNSQEVAVKQQLVQEGEEFRLTDDQKKAIDYLDAGLKRSMKRLLLKAPTGSGKTEVMMRLGVGRHLSTSRPVLIIAPTRDLARQHVEYLEQRLKGTPLGNIAVINGGLEPRKRQAELRNVLEGKSAFVVASALVIHNQRYKALWDSLGLLIIDDVNAFDEDEHLRPLRSFPGPTLYMSATPEAVKSFLRADGAWDNQIEMTEMPFETTPTDVETKDIGSSHPILQLSMGPQKIQEHIDKGSRIYIISRLKREVENIADYLKRTFSVPVFCLHGDMADSREHQKRRRKRPGAIKTTDHRITMMNEFRNTCPSIMVATNLIGSGIDIPMADLIVITDSHTFSDSEKEQLIGRVGRRERLSEALLLEGDSPRKEREMKNQVKFSTRPAGQGRVRYSFAPRTGAMGGRKRR
jgi:RecG-like helicase